MVSDQGLHIGNGGSESVLGFAIAVPIHVEHAKDTPATRAKENVIGNVGVGACKRLALGQAGEVEALGLVASAEFDKQ